jgi:erythromycin esterase-like protein
MSCPSEQNTRGRRFELGQELGPAVYMGDFLNVEVVNHCVLIAQRMLLKMMSPAAGSLRVHQNCFQHLSSPCGTKKTFTNLTELFSECRTVASSEIKKEEREWNCHMFELHSFGCGPTRAADHTVSCCCC